MHVLKVAETHVNTWAINEALEILGAPKWTTDAHNYADYLAEFMGRLCYKSFDVGLNPNVTKVREGNNLYLGNLQGQRHGSVFEHASVSFVFLDVSRILTHELVRHRVGIGYSQESQRFVRLDDFDCYVPNIDDPLHEIADLVMGNSSGYTEEERQTWVNDKATRYIETFDEVNRSIQDKVAVLIKELELDDPKVPFHVKKEITSALRRMVPGGVNTNIGASANHRTWRYLIETRTSPGAEIEIRHAFVEVGKIMVRDHPNTYQDAHFHIGKEGSHDPGFWTFDNSKI